jgi:transposase
MSDSALEALLFPAAVSRDHAPRPLPHWRAVHEELQRKGVTLFLLWEEYKAVHPKGYEYSRFCDLYRAWAGKLPVWMRQEHKAGEKLFVDYAGMTMPVVNPGTGEVRQAQIFVATLGASNYTYAEGTWTQTLPEWIASHVRAFEFFGGAPELVIPDNLRSGVSYPCRYDPDANPTYREFAEHYGTAIMPARAAKPKDKAKVESGVQGVERRILAKLRNRTFFSLAELNQAISCLLVEYNRRPFQQLEGSRRSLFLKLDKPVLQPLPATRYEYAEWVKARVSLDYHVRADDHCYSVPYRLVKEQVEVRLTATAVEIFHRGVRVASHLRAHQKNRFTTKTEHMPERHRVHAEWTPERVIRWVGRAGEATAEVAEQIIASRPHPQQGFRACMGIKRLGETYGADRLEAACRRALAIQSASYRSVKSILENRLDQKPLETQPPRTPPIHHENVRGADYYQTHPTQREPTPCSSIPPSTNSAN